MKKLFSMFIVSILLSTSVNAGNKVIAKYCGPDAHRFCANVPEAHGKKYRCLVRHGRQLTAACRVTLEVATSLIVEHAKKVCRIDARHLCHRIQAGRGRILKCLSRNINQLNRSCASIVTKLSGIQHRRSDQYSGD